MTSITNYSLSTTLSSLPTESSRPQCYKEANLCHSFNKSSVMCFGATLPYDSTSFELVSDASNFSQAKEKLLLWSGLRAVPRCWDVIQPLLCSVYYPPCQNNQINLPDRSLCTATRGPCKIVDTEYGWPDFLQCTNNGIYRDGCLKSEHSLSFNKSTCEPPLIATNNSASFYDEVDGCGLQCMNPLYDQAEHDEIHAFIAGWAIASCLCTLFAMLSFFIDWKNSSRYPARIIFYINVCFFLGGIGWLAQFFPGARDEIVCRKDGTMRLAEPVGTDESGSCVIVFLIVYFFLMAGIIWFDILSYSWFLMFKALGNYEDPLAGKERRFHLIAWSIPSLLSIVAVLVSQIDGDSMSGICFIGYKNYIYRLIFLLIPVGIVLFIGGFFIFRGLTTLFTLKKTNPSLLNDTLVSKINWTIIRIGLFAILAFASVFVTFSAHLYDYTNQAIWEKSFREYIKCEANVTILEQLSGSLVQQCVLQNHPSLSILKLNLIALFGTGIVMSTWVWTKSTLSNWRRTWYKLIGRSDNEMRRIRQRSKIIARAFANRKMFRRKCGKKKPEFSDEDDDSVLEELEYSDHTMTHQDPAEMNFYLNCNTPDISSAWLHNVPKIVERRGGILPEGRSSVRTSLDLHGGRTVLPTRQTINDDLEPGLWAVSQYFDGCKVKAKTSGTKPARKVAPIKPPNDVFIGTSPYNYPLKPPVSLVLPPIQYETGHCFTKAIHPSTQFLPPVIPHHGERPCFVDPRFIGNAPDHVTVCQDWFHPSCVSSDPPAPEQSGSQSRPSTASSSRGSSSRRNSSNKQSCHCPQPRYAVLNKSGCRMLPVVYHPLPYTHRKPKAKPKFVSNSLTK